MWLRRFEPLCRVATVAEPLTIGVFGHYGCKLVCRNIEYVCRVQEVADVSQLTFLNGRLQDIQ